MVVQWLRQGVPLRWKGAPPRQRVEEKDRQPREVEEEMDKLVQAGAFVEQACRVTSPVFTIPKKDGTNRLIHDLRQINIALDAPRFTLRGPKEAAEVVRESGALVSLDLRRGYQQVAMSREARDFLGARWRGRQVASTVLPFGLSISPYIFTRITGWLARTIRSRFGLSAAVYIDDFLIGAETPDKLREGLGKVKELFERLGVCLSPKTAQTPSEEVEYLGLVWNARDKTVSITDQRRKEYRRRIKNLLRAGQTRKVWQQTIGKLLFLREVVGPTVRHVRSLLHQIRRRPEGKLIQAEGEAREDLVWWLNALSHPVSFSLQLQPVSATITTDASEDWLGGIIELWNANQDKVGGAQGAKGVQVSGVGTQQQQEKQQETRREVFQGKASYSEKHINIKELEALYEAVRTNIEKLEGRRALWFTDSTTAKAAIARQGTQNLSREAWATTKRILDLLQERNISLIPQHVPGRLNCGVDSLSRPTEEKLSWEGALCRITEKWGPLQEDPCGFTREPTSNLETLEWRRRRTLLVPPIHSIGRVVELLRGVAGQAPGTPPSAWERMCVLVTPLWRGATWWPALVRLRSEWMALGRLPHRGLRAWEERNGHQGDWTASLIALKEPSGPLER